MVELRGVDGGKFLISIVLFHKQTTKVLFSLMNYQSMGKRTIIHESKL